MITDVGSMLTMFDIDRYIVLDQTRLYSLTQIFRQIAKFTAGRIVFNKVWSYNIVCLIWTVHLMLGQTTLPTQILRQIAKFSAGRIAFERVWSHNIIWIKALCVCSTKWDSHGAWLVYVLAVNQITYTFGGSMGDGVVGIQLPYLFLSEAICHD